MSNRLDSLSDFEIALEEVELLILFAKEFANNNDDNQSAFKKSAILLLTAKFENFLETVVEDYIAKINELRILSSRIPDELLFQHTFQALEKIEKLKHHRHKYEELKAAFKGLALIWGMESHPVSLDIKSKFNYGKHGENDLINLFKKIGIENIFLDVKVLSNQENILDDLDLQEIDIKGTFNSVINLRNQIIHADASPSIGIDSVEEYKEHLKLFAEELINFLEKKTDEFLFEV